MSYIKVFDLNYKVLKEGNRYTLQFSRYIKILKFIPYKIKWYPFIKNGKPFYFSSKGMMIEALKLELIMGVVKGDYK